MIPWKQLASARAPDGAALTLWQRGDELVVRVGSVDLMSTRVHGSEEQLAEHGCAGLGEGARVLVGGLGLGFTLRAALAAIPATARVVVAELCPEIVAWVRGPVGGAAILDDPRVSVDLRDVALVIGEASARFDAILLDVDNGPSALTQAGNSRLYGPRGLAAAARALRPGGRLAVWSAGDDPAFARRLEAAGFTARAIRVRAHRAAPQIASAPPRPARGSGARQVVFVGEIGR